MSKLERLMNLLVQGEQRASENDEIYINYAKAMVIADYLLEHGVDVQEKSDDNTLNIDDDVWYVDVYFSAIAYSVSIIKGRIISIDNPRSLYGCFTVKPYIDIEMPIFKVSDIGTKVFRSREEAQQALKDYVRKL